MKIKISLARFFAKPEFAKTVLLNSTVNSVEKGFLLLETEVGIDFRLLTKEDMAAMLYLLCSKEIGNKPSHTSEYIASVAIARLLPINIISEIVALAAINGISDYKSEMIPLIDSAIVREEVK